MQLFGKCHHNATTISRDPPTVHHVVKTKGFVRGRNCAGLFVWCMCTNACLQWPMGSIGIGALQIWYALGCMYECMENYSARSHVHVQGCPVIYEWVSALEEYLKEHAPPREEEEEEDLSTEQAINNTSTKDSGAGEGPDQQPRFACVESEASRVEKKCFRLFWM
eukprot:m.114959 g.114959  ORF g.114959 m.114959 type:complete len:165 (+) comp13550_c0_seq8:48-542(+)